MAQNRRLYLFDIKDSLNIVSAARKCNCSLQRLTEQTEQQKRPIFQSTRHADCLSLTSRPSNAENRRSISSKKQFRRNRHLSSENPILEGISSASSVRSSGRYPDRRSKMIDVLSDRRSNIEDVWRSWFVAFEYRI